MPGEAEPTTDVVAQAMSVLAEHNAENPPDAEEEGEAPAAEPEPEAAAPETPAEPPAAAAPSKAEEIRRIALERRAKLEEAEQARLQQQAPQRPDPFAEYQADELRQAIEFTRLFQRDPMAAIERAGHDKSAIYERLTKDALNPGMAQQMTAAETAAARAEAAEKAAQQAQAEFRQYVQAQEAQRRFDTYVKEINTAASDATAYPNAARLDEGTRVRWAAEEERDMLRMGYQPTALELVVLVEERAANLKRLLAGETTQEAGTRPGGTPKAGKSAGAATTRSSQTLTNDLASQSGPPAEVDYSPEAAERRALLAARELWTSSE